MTRLGVAFALLVACGSTQEPRPPAAREAPRARTEDHSHDAASGGPDAGVAIVAVAQGATPASDASIAIPTAAPTTTSPAQRALDAMTPHRLPPPPTSQTVARRPSPVRSARLRRVSARRNGVTDVDAWFAANQLRDPALRGYGRPATLDPSRYPQRAEYRLHRVVEQPGLSILFFIPQRASARTGHLVAVVSDDGTPRAFFDFSEWSGGPASGVNAMVPTFAWVVGNLLYVSHGHRTYASATGGQNAYLSAIDMNGGALVWRSAPLAANTRTFAVVGDVIVTGYGFTDEKDYLYVLDRHTGRRMGRSRLEAGPRFILERGGRIYVRAYDRDYEFELTVRTR